MKEADDITLVQRCLKGDIKAFEAIVDRYQKSIFNVAFRLVNDYQDAEDITQAVFVKAYEKLKTFNPQYKFFSWFYRIAINESLNFLKSRKRLESIDRDYISTEKTPEESYNEVELSEHIQTALMCLKPEYRAVIILRYFQDLTYKEIEYILEIPEKTVKSRLFSARQQLKEILIKRGYYR